MIFFFYYMNVNAEREDASNLHVTRIAEVRSM